MRNLIKKVHTAIRERPSLFSTPHCHEKDSDGNTIPAVEEWRNQRIKYESKRWEVGIWTTQYGGDQEVLGLIIDGVSFTHYAFYLDDILANPRAIENGIHFDAGTSCTELYIEPNEWKRVLNELDVMSRYLALHPEAVDTKTEQTEESNPNVRSTEPVVNG